jgi:hypothetical protein
MQGSAGIEAPLPSPKEAAGGVGLCNERHAQAHPIGPLTQQLPALLHLHLRTDVSLHTLACLRSRAKLLLHPPPPPPRPRTLRRGLNSAPTVGTWLILSTVCKPSITCSRTASSPPSPRRTPPTRHDTDAGVGCGCEEEEEVGGRGRGCGAGEGCGAGRGGWRLTWPTTTCLPSRKEASSHVTMKNWHPLVFGPAPPHACARKHKHANA